MLFFKGLKIKGKIISSLILMLLIIWIIGILTFLYSSSYLNTRTNTVLVIFSMIIILSGIISIAIVNILIDKIIIKPLKTLNLCFRDIASGNLRIKKKEIRSDDEISETADIFNKMIENLISTIGNIKEISDSAVTAADKIAVSVGAIKTASNLQTEKITDTSSAITEMSSSVQQITRSSKNAETMSEESAQAAAAGAIAVKETIDGLQTIAANIKTAGIMTKKLGERSQEIGKIVNTITEISEQTNLLALNAAIEAARAGEHGKGFAVVADEVRRLAERVALSAKEIGRIIEKIQGEMDSTIITMQKSSKSATEGMSLADGLNTSFIKIQNNVNNTNISIEEIANALSQQSMVCNDIVSATEAINNSVNESDENFSFLIDKIETLKNIKERFNQEISKLNL